MKSKTLSVFNFLLFVSFIYLAINYFIYVISVLFFFIVITAILVKHTFLYLDNDKNLEMMNNVFKKASLQNNQKLARSIFKWNIVGRYILKILLDKHLLKENSVDNIEECLKFLEIKEKLTTSVIKKAWKEQAKIFHPDKFQDENDKIKANERFAQLTDCRNKLLNYLKDTNV